MILRCRKCHAILPPPREHPDGLAGVLYDICNGCGWSRAITKKPRAVKLSTKSSTTRTIINTEKPAMTTTKTKPLDVAMQEMRRPVGTAMGHPLCETVTVSLWPFGTAHGGTSMCVTLDADAALDLANQILAARMDSLAGFSSTEG